jgi:hypothetical protein
MEEHRNLLHKLVFNTEDALHNGKRVRISLEKIQRLYPCGTLYFTAHMERLIEQYPGRVSFTYPCNDVVEQLFQHIGLLRLGGLTKRKKVCADNVKHWNIVRGDSADISGFHELQQRYWQTLGAELGMILGGCMGEAVTNCVQHAYPKQQNTQVRWWMFAEYRDEKLTIAIFDLGIGIAKSLRSKPSLIDTIAAAFKDPVKDDCKLLANAVGSNLTSTQLPYRGKGLPEMLENAKSNKIGGLLIHSNHGVYSFSSSENKDAIHGYKKPIDGTLVEWSIPISQRGIR